MIFRRHPGALAILFDMVKTKPIRCEKMGMAFGRQLRRLHRRLAAQKWVLQTPLRALRSSACSTRSNGIRHAAKRRKVSDPAQEGHDNHGDDNDGHEEQDDAPLRAIKPGLEHNDADETVKERTEECRQHGLGGRVFDEEPGRARRGGEGQTRDARKTP